MLEISKYNKDSSEYNLYKNLLLNLKFSKDLEQSTREKSFLKDICNRVEKSKTVLYVLKLDSEIIGLVSLSATSIDDQPSLQIDYIFVNDLYRGKELKALDNLKPFRYLIELTINLAEEIKSSIGLRWIVLSPDNEDLKNKYKKVNFQSVNDDWMYLKL